MDVAVRVGVEKHKQKCFVKPQAYLRCGSQPGGIRASSYGSPAQPPSEPESWQQTEPTEVEVQLHAQSRWAGSCN